MSKSMGGDLFYGSAYYEMIHGNCLSYVISYKLKGLLAQCVESIAYEHSPSAQMISP